MRGVGRFLAMLCLLLAGWSIADVMAEPVVDGAEINMSSDRFVRGAALPSWVRPLAPLPTKRLSPVVIRLHDTQFKMAPTPTVYVNKVIQANDASVLGAIGQIQLQIVPQYQKLSLHSVRLLRGDRVIDRTREVSVRFLQREGRLEQGVYGGTVTVAILLDDVRVGDSLEIQYSVEGQNPIFEGRFSDFAGWDQGDPIELRRVSVLHPSERALRWRLLGDFRPISIEPKVSDFKGERLVEFEERGIEGLTFEPFIPVDYLPARMIQFSEYADWAEVNRWAMRLFETPVALPEEAVQQVTRLRKLSSAEARIAAALRWVQGEIRYFSVSLGESSHRPYPPTQVLARRYGDCKDKTYLLVAMLRELGVEADPVFASLRAPKVPAKMLPAPDAFDHAIVRVRVNNRDYYLDPAAQPQSGALDRLGPYVEGSEVLVIAPSTKNLETVSQPGIRDLVQVELFEEFTVKEMGAAGTLQVKQVWHGNGADRIRLLIAQQTPEQLRKLAMGNYERQYNGAVLSGDPVFEDDLEINAITFKARYTIPKLTQEADKAWALGFFPANLRGIFNVPDKLVRSYPLAAQAVPYEARYQLNVDWPEAVSVLQDPSLQRVRGDQFEATVAKSFRGNKTQVTVSFSSRSAEVPAARVQQFSDDIKNLNKAVGGVVMVDRNSIKSVGLFASSLQESLKVRLTRQWENVDRVIKANRLKDDDLVEALCSRAETLADLERSTEGIPDAEEAVRVGPAMPRSWMCRGNLGFASGRFGKAVSDYTKALSLGADPFMTHYRRGHARFYLGHLEQAAQDFAKAVENAQQEADQVYAKIWWAWTLQRLGRPLPDTLTKQGRESLDAPWPSQGLAMFAGALTPDDLISAVNRKSGDEREMTLAEAWFFVGQHHLVNRRPEDAKNAFRNCRDKGITVYIEHVAAGYELERLEAAR